MHVLKLSSFLLLSALSHISSLSTAALTAILKGMTLCTNRVAAKHLIRSMVAVCAGQEDFFSANVVSKAVLKAIVGLE